MNYQETNNFNYSCKWIEGGMVFGSDAIYICCVNHKSSNGGWIPICNYSDYTEFNDELANIILKKRDEIRILNQTEKKYLNCRGCSQLVKSHWKKSKYLLNLISLTYSTYCNFKCSYCYLKHDKDIKRDNNPDFLPFIKSIIDSGILDKNTEIFWGGGEPLLFNNFKQIVKLLLKNNCYQIFNTNGSIYSDCVDEVLKSNQGKIVCSIDAGLSATYQKIKGKSNYFDRVWENIAKYSNKKNIFAKYILLKENNNKANIINFIELCKHNGITNVICDLNSMNATVNNSICSGIAYMIKIARLNNIQISLSGIGIESLISEKSTNVNELLKKVFTQLKKYI
jgi:sulfatase maturation enzyme AslB (radical SAM superfamily)